MNNRICRLITTNLEPKGFILNRLKCSKVLLNSPKHFSLLSVRRTTNAPLLKSYYIRFQRQASHKAAVVKEFSKELVIKEQKSLSLKDKEVRVKVHNCAVNVSDVLFCDGEYDVKPKLPFVPGFEVSGEISEVGSKVSEYHKGDRVVGLSKETYHGFSEECILNEQDLWKIPQKMKFNAAAALLDNYVTVLIAARRVDLKQEDTVLVTAAAGGLGLAAVDIAANLFKAKVIGASDTEDKATLLRDKGAFAAINYNKKEILEAVMQTTKGAGVRVVFDAVGGDIFDTCLECISHEGSIVVTGFASRQIPKIMTSQLLPKACALIGVSLREYRAAVNEVYRNTVQEIIDMCNDDFIEPSIAKTFKLEKVNDAIKFLKEKKSTGKVLLDMSK